MRTLFVVLAAHMVSEKGFSRPRWPKNEFITIGNNSLFHGQVGNIHMERFPAYSVCHLDTKRTDRIAVVCFFGKEAKCRFNKRIETFFAWKIPAIAGHGCPIQCSGIYGIMSWFTLHKCQLATYIVTDMFEFFLVITPRQYVEMCSN